MAAKQIQFKLGKNSYALHLPEKNTDMQELGRSFVIAGIELIGIDNIEEYVTGLKYAPGQKQFTWMASNELEPG